MKVKKKRFTENEVREAGSVSIVSYARQTGYEVSKTKHGYKIKGYGGLYINEDENKWHWFTRDIGGGIIKFVMEMEEKTWIQAVYTLLKKKNLSCSKQMVMEEKKKGELVAPKKNSTYKHIIAYLIKTRGIDKDVVYHFINEKKLYENTYKSCVFIGYDDNAVIKYLTVRSTNTEGAVFKGEVQYSEKQYPFCNTGNIESEKVFVFESPIDIMSYMTLCKEKGKPYKIDHMISLGGLSDLALKSYLDRYPKIKHIVICIDNDESGDFAYDQFREKYVKYKIERCLPEAKDFNEELQAYLKIKMR